METSTGVLNPYALAELIAEKQIRWSSLADPVAELSAILHMPEAKIFADDSALLRPFEISETADTRKMSSPADAKARITSYIKSNQISSQTDAPTRLNALTGDRIANIAELLVPGQVENGQPWQPANMVWFDKGDFYEDVNEVNDPIQGSLGNCYFIAALSSVAWARPYAIANVIRPSSWGNEDAPIHKVVFYKNGTGNGETVEVSERVPVQQGSLAWKYARSRDAGEIWPAVMEKAYSKWRTGNTTDFPDYTPTAGGSPVAACAQIVRGTQNSKSNASTTADALFTAVGTNSLSKRTFNPMVAWTYKTSPAGANYTAARVVGNHAYSVLGWETRNGVKYIVLRNPWGTHEATLDVLSGSWASGGSYPASLALNTDGVFAMKASTFKQYFAGLGWVV
jgi:hypothetical protein